MDEKKLLQAGPIGRKTDTGAKHLVQSAATTIFIFSMPASACASTLVSSLGGGRLLPAVAAMIALVGIFVGRLAWSRSRSPGNRQAGAIVAAVLGIISLTTGVLHSANSAGSFGTGNGLAGAIVAIALGLISMTLGGLAFFRSRRITPNNEDRI